MSMLDTAARHVLRYMREAWPALGADQYELILARAAKLHKERQAMPEPPTSLSAAEFRERSPQLDDPGRKRTRGPRENPLKPRKK